MVFGYNFNGIWILQFGPELIVFRDNLGSIWRQFGWYFDTTIWTQFGYYFDSIWILQFGDNLDGVWIVRKG